MTSSSKFLCRSQMIIPFSGNYHVPDVIDWRRFSRPQLVDPRSAKKRRTKGQRIRDAADGLQKAQGSFHPGQFWLQMSGKEVFYCFGRFAWRCCRVLLLVLCVTPRLLQV